MPLRCVRCDYDLRAAPADGVCPECGTAVAASIAAREFASTDAGRTLRATRVGLALLLLAMLVTPLNLLADLVRDFFNSLVRGGYGFLANAVVADVAALLFATGLALVTVRRGDDEWPRLRRAIRVAAAILVANRFVGHAAVATMMWPRTPFAFGVPAYDALRNIEGLLGFAAGLALCVLGAAQLARLAEHAFDERLARRLRHVGRAWVGVLVALPIMAIAADHPNALGGLCGTLPIVWLIGFGIAGAASLVAVALANLSLRRFARLARSPLEEPGRPWPEDRAGTARR